MSITIMAAVFQSGLNKSEKMIALAYADHADDEGCNIYPSIDYTAWKTGYSDRSVQTTTQKLIDKGILKPDGISRFGTNKYRFVVERLPKRSPYKGGEKISGGVKSTTGGGEIYDKNPAQISPKSSDNNHQDKSPTKSPSDLPQTENPLTEEIPIKEQPEIHTEPELTPQKKMFGVLCKVMKRDPKLEPKRTGNYAKKYLDGGYTPEQIDLWYSPGDNYYWREYYKGRNGEYPNESDITKTLILSREYQEQRGEGVELTPEIQELEEHFENRTGFYIPPLGKKREEEWIKPCNAMLARSEGLGAAKSLMDRALEKARESECSYKAPSSILTFALNLAPNGNGSAAKAVGDSIGGFYT